MFLLHFVNFYAVLLLGQLKSKGERTVGRGLYTRSNENAAGQDKILLNIPK